MLQHRQVMAVSDVLPSMKGVKVEAPVILSICRLRTMQHGLFSQCLHVSATGPYGFAMPEGEGRSLLIKY